MVILKEASSSSSPTNKDHNFRWSLNYFETTAGCSSSSTDDNDNHYSSSPGDDQECDSESNMTIRNEALLYDVYLSFRGADTRLNFTNHLHKALESANLKTFLDSEEIQMGQRLKPELENAIKSSRAFIIVLSKNYATSTWCLDELVLILEQHKKFNQLVIPVFYHVDPSDVRKQQSSFRDAMEHHKDRMEAETNVEEKTRLADKIDIWKQALTQVSNLIGKDAKGRLETEFIEEIVKNVYHRLGVALRSNLPQQLIGIDHSIDFVTSWLKDGSKHTADVLTILGMGGIGKTTLAKYVYGLHSREFNKSSFIEDINRRSAQINGLLVVTKQLYNDILKTSYLQTHDVSVYTSAIENELACKKVLVVLDDIDSLSQLDALLGNKGFYPGSKVIITTKDASLTERCALFNPQVQPKHTIHLLKGLHGTASQKVLCVHAFNCEDPKQGYEEVLDNIVKYCDGHPLALKVLGRSLRNRDVVYWKDCIKSLKIEPGTPIYNVLKMSFDSLPSNDKELFKYIACFFVGGHKYFVEKILEACDINTRSGITNLIDRCLLRIGLSNELIMHSLIQKMGRSEVSRESPDKPEERSRLWCHKDIIKVLKQKKGTGNIKGISLGTEMFETEKSSGSLFELETDAFSKMYNLVILHLDNVEMNGSYENFPEEVIWLRMRMSPLKSIPLELPMKNLVALDMSYSKIESFDMSCSNALQSEKRQKLCSKPRRLLGSLKILDLSYCDHLCSIGGFCELPALENLYLRNCESLTEICESIEQCDELVLIDLSYCNEFKMLGRTIDKLKKVKTLSLEGCNLGELSFEITLQTSSSAILEAIPRDIKSMAIFSPSSLVRLYLANNNLSCESFPMDLSFLCMLTELYLDLNPIVSMPNCVRSLPRLKTLSLNNCKKLTSIKYPPRTLTYACFNGPLLREVLFDKEMSSIELMVDLCSSEPLSLEIIEGIFKIQPMADVEGAVLPSLGWSEMEFVKERCVRTYNFNDAPKESQTQIYYEFGIFSTIYGGKEMPNWIRRRSKGSSISFTIPSSPKRLRGLNFSYVLKFLDDFRYSVDASEFPVDLIFYMPVIRISNVTKKRTWIYNHYVDRANVGGKHLTFLSHWMFGTDEMRGGDRVTVTVAEDDEQHTRKCGVGFVYDDGGIEKEDALTYYKSWNHILGGDLSPFQLTTQEYILDNKYFTWFTDDLTPVYPPYSADGICYKETKRVFKAFSERNSCIHGHALEEVTK